MYRVKCRFVQVTQPMPELPNPHAPAPVAPVPARRRGERGAAMIVVMTVMLTLAGVAAITLVGVQSEMRSAGSTRFRQAALYAAESGVASGMDFLRGRCNATTRFSDWVEPSADDPQQPTEIVGNGIEP